MKALQAGVEKRSGVTRGLRARQGRRAGVPAWMGCGVVAALVASSLPAWAADPAAPVGMAVTVTRVKNACFADSMVAMGNVVARNEVLVRPDREGLQIKDILVEAGSSVSASTVLAHLVAPNDPQTIVAITSPVGGLVLAAPTVVGAMASARGDPLFRIAADSDMDLSAEVPAKQASRLAVGQEVKVKVAGMDELLGHVRLVSTVIDPTTQLGQMRIAIAHNPLVRVGAFARATISFGQSCGVSLPLSALLFGPDGSVVQTIRNDRVETRRVTTGLTAQNNVQIRQGLGEGDMIVVRAGAFLREGDRVRPVVAAQ
jgi:multidrug efflux pump subunit AcrA (membrane-fusion protein)